ncbi:TetR/AcrR family transcriptional regulator [Sediminicoccus rosea]|jgi:AcrR family transcriptional regulator|uniref:TetR family transcriptional regulator n=1 Tax=Sediminicoccus rosea TaxID=1225128 RepID=A0ABZ0PFT6_9PROT|nr:TetR family transcriptional regulator [Sediminicoccus rosea]WPB84467.1 TetR family transcriptional regulator [Sediminicoccus rosea]
MNVMDPHSATRARIADAAEALFRQIGYQKTSVADIAKACAMSPANVYRFYPSKSAINEAITHRLLDTIGTELEALAAGPGTPAERMRATAAHLFRRDVELFFAEKRMHDMVGAAMTEHWGVIEGFIARVLAVWEGLLREGMASGAFRALDPAATAMSFKQCLLLWTHPILLEDCLGRGETPEGLGQQQQAALDLLLAGVARN